MKSRSTRLRGIRHIDPYFWLGCLSILVVGAGLFWKRADAASGSFTPVDIPDRLMADLGARGLATHLGSADAPVQVVELFDYQCPACSAAHMANWPVLRRHADQGLLRFTTYDVPLPSHPNAIPASVAAGCVSSRAPAVFWDYRHRLLASQGAWESNGSPQAFFIQLAADAGADTAAVRSCMAGEGEARGQALSAAWQLTSAAAITYSPVWEVNGKAVRWNEVPREIEAALARVR